MQIPVIVLSGFLGSGKTTLLLRMLEEANQRGLQPGILMNELGKQDVDGMILDGRGGAAMEKLLDGCVCCSKKSELAGSLVLLLRKKPDVIVIELTGVANPEEIADALTEPELIGSLALRQIVTVLDAEYVLDYNSIFSSDRQLVRTLRRQIETADRLIVNKTDLVTPSLLQKIEKTVRKMNARAPIAFTSHSRAELAPLFAGIKPQTPAVPASSALRYKPLQVVSPSAISKASSPHTAGTEQLHEHNRSYSRVRTLTLPGRLAESSSQASVESFMRRWKHQLLRAKGYIVFPRKQQTYLMQYAGKRTYWEPAAYSGEPYVVLIGIDLDEAALADAWNALV
ncbi:CobW family GTP-binding protein [Paenibacillus thalictri]|uniref:GTP-binding protein n=1 Tax=Paenibacillus thalictri TaxID=2527873 RepID=A0A4Q9DHB0_9BACL|nr:GTP-binding protein [Paenibacillus thalictri]TBL70825.1 GTP-binding protein [Paenibacillus thalictri]